MPQNLFVGIYDMRGERDHKSSEHRIGHRIDMCT